MTTHYNFQSKVGELTKQTGNCSDFDAVAELYIQAAQWERQSGDKISSVVGTNSAVDMDLAAEQLTAYRANCQSCGATACLFAGVERISPTDVLGVLAN
jgi:hypothetical protein